MTGVPRRAWGVRSAPQHSINSGWLLAAVDKSLPLHFASSDDQRPRPIVIARRCELVTTNISLTMQALQNNSMARTIYKCREFCYN